MRSVWWSRISCGLVLAWLFGVSAPSADAQDSTGALLEVELTPTARTQIAIWLEDPEGRLLRTLALTESVAYRGIGNRPGASEMNSGYRWPYGRREGVLPIWASRRAAAPGAQRFKRVIFQKRSSEGRASQTSGDQSVDDYYCLSFNKATTRRDALDAVSCASVFSSDKGRFMTEADLAAGYAEPWLDPVSGESLMTPLPLTSLYPPRMDVELCEASSTCRNHADAYQLADAARAVMPEIDEITMATPPGDEKQSFLFSLPDDLPQGEYTLWIEVGLEGDYGGGFDATTYPTPILPAGEWDGWAIDFGYAYRGQPSIAYKVPIRLTDPGTSSAEAYEPAGMTSWNVWDEDYGALLPLEGIVDDPSGAPGSGADRLRMDEDGARVRVTAEVIGLPEPEGDDPWSAMFERDPPSDADPAPGDDTDDSPAPDGVDTTDLTDPDKDDDSSGDDGDDELGVGDAGVSARLDQLDEGEGVILVGTQEHAEVGPVRNLRLRQHSNALRSHQWVLLSFLAAKLRSTFAPLRGAREH